MHTAPLHSAVLAGVKRHFRRNAHFQDQIICSNKRKTEGATALLADPQNEMLLGFTEILLCLLQATAVQDGNNF